MQNIGFVGLIIILSTLIFTYKGLKDLSFFEKYQFKIDKILIFKEYQVIISSGFLHADWWHFGFNMLTFYFFSASVEKMMGFFPFICLYFLSLIGGNLLALWIHRNHGDYTAIGASGAVSGIVFSSIALFPSLKIGLLFLPFSLPAWLFGILYMLYTMYGIKSQKDNIGHEAHLGGAIIGMLLSIAFFPQIAQTNYIRILIILIPMFLFLLFIVKNPYFLLISPVAKRKQNIEEKFHNERISKQKEIDKLLDKISAKGINSLSPKERERLKELSK